MQTVNNATIRKQIPKGLKRIVIKVGSSVISNREQEKAGLVRGLCEQTVRLLADEIRWLLEANCQVALVSSGAVMAGRNRLNFGHHQLSIPERQACAAIGQSFLMRAYEKAFEKHGLQVAQILLDHHDLVSRKRYLNAKNTLDTLLAHHVVPIVNENDTVSVDEIMIGDNDALSADVACLIDAQLLLILSDVDGLFTGDPMKSSRSGNTPELIPLVTQVTPELERLAGNTSNRLTVGGMGTKLRAAKKTMSFGIPAVVINGIDLSQIRKVFEGRSVGTLFWSGRPKIKNRKYWIAHTLKPKGSITIDAGAQKAIVERGKSLLSVGVVRVEGEFQFGNAVRILGSNRKEVARGLVNYSAQDLDRIKGIKTDAVRKLLRSNYYEEVIHRNDLVVL